MKRLIRIMIALIIVATSGLAVANGIGTNKGIGTYKGRANLVPDEIIVKYDRTVTSGRKAGIRQAYGLTKKRDSLKHGAFVVYKHRNPHAIMNMLKHEPGVISVEQNAYAYAYMVPNDPFYSYQWHMQRIGMENAWNENDGAGSVVAVIDTGVKQSLEDLAGTSFSAGYDFVNSDDDPTDDEGHGSHVAGTVAQTTNNNTGVAGVAFNATIMPIKVLNWRGSGTYDDIADGIYFATTAGADVINMSLGGPTSLTILEDAVNEAWSSGVVVVCAAGNENSDVPSYPAAYENAISVSATTSLDTLASYSNYGDTIDIAAPGGDSGDNNGDGYDDMILQNTFSRSGEGYYFYAGTSMASPHVAGVAALVKSANPALGNDQIRGILETTAEDLGDPDWDPDFGYGLVDAYAAVLAAGGDGGGDVTPPVLSDFSETAITTTSATINWTTDEAADSVVEFGLTTSYGSQASNDSLVTVHSVELTGLSPDTEYHYKASSADAAGNTAESTDRTFTTLQESGDVTMFVADIAMTKSNRGRNLLAYATVTIEDSEGDPVSGATVYGEWSGVVSGTDTGITGSDGTVTFTSDKTKSSGTFTFTVTDVTHETLDYDDTLNVETSDSI